MGSFISIILTGEQMRHDRILSVGKGQCEVCGKSYTEILFEDSFSEITTGSHARADSESPSWHNAIKVLENR